MLVENANLRSQNLSRKGNVAKCEHHPLARYYHQILGQRPLPPLKHQFSDRALIIQKPVRPREDE